MKRATIGLAIMLALVIVPAAQVARPNLSGKWIQVTVVDGKEVVDETLVVTQTAKELTTASYDSNGQPGERGVRFVFGESVVQQTPPGTEGIATAAWKGSALFVTIALKVRGELRSTIEQSWSLDAARNLVIDSTRRPVSGPPEIRKIIFKRSDR